MHAAEAAAKRAKERRSAAQEENQRLKIQKAQLEQQVSDTHEEATERERESSRWRSSPC